MTDQFDMSSLYAAKQRETARRVSARPSGETNSSGTSPTRVKMCLMAKVGLAATVVVALLLSVSYGGRLRSPIDNIIYANDTCPIIVDLSSDVKLGVCARGGNLVVDIRHYENEQPTIKGVSLSVTEYFALGQQFSDVYDRLQTLLGHGPKDAVHDARRRSIGER